jgi:hypothetical protein
MSVVAEFTVQADEFLLGDLLSRDPVGHIEMERVVPTSRRLMPYVWVHGGRFEEFEAAIRDSEHVADIEVLDRTDDSALYRIEWEEAAEGLIDGIAETNATILDARGKQEWYFRIRFPTHSEFKEFARFCRSNDIRFELNRVYTVSAETSPSDLGLTETQLRTVTRAVRDGYFEVPRRTTLTEIGETLDITEQTVSENLRRGVDTVLKQVLFEE